jgi:hypothetical protein
LILGEADEADLDIKTFNQWIGDKVVCAKRL